MPKNSVKAENTFHVTVIAAFTLVLALTMAAQGQNQRLEIRIKDPITRPNAANDDCKRGSISGTVRDGSGTAIPNAVLGVTGDQRLVSSTDDEGQYSIEDLADGEWTIECAAAGYKNASMTLTILNGRSLVRDLTLEPQDRFVAADIRSKNEYASKLSRAVADGDLRAVRELLASGIDVNPADDDFNGITPLFIAVENGNAEIAEMLLEFGAKVNARDENGQTALMRIDSDADEKLVEILLNNGAEANLTDRYGNNALIVVAGNGAAEAVIDRIARATDDIDLQNSAGRTALMEAANSDNLEAVRVLVLAGAAVNLKDRAGESAWDLAGDTAVEALLEEFGAEIG